VKSGPVPFEEKYTTDNKSEAPSRITFQRRGCFTLMCSWFYASESKTKTCCSAQHWLVLTWEHTSWKWQFLGLSCWLADF